jgi:hypothetical protein
MSEMWNSSLSSLAVLWFGILGKMARMRRGLNRHSHGKLLWLKISEIKFERKIALGRIRPRDGRVCPRDGREEGAG